MSEQQSKVKIKVEKIIEVTEELTPERSIGVKTIDGKIFAITSNTDKYQGYNRRDIDFEGTEKDFSEMFDKLLTLLIQAREEFNKA